MNAWNLTRSLARKIRQRVYPIRARNRSYIRFVADNYGGQLPPMMVCLDLGSGVAPYRKLIRQHFDIGIYVSFDLAPSDATNLVGDISTLPIVDDCASLIVVMETLQHVPDASKAFNEMARTLTPEGLAIISFPFMFAECDARDFRRWTVEGMKHELARCGLEVLHVRKHGGVFFVFASFLHWGVQHLLPGTRKAWRLKPTPWNITRAILVQCLALPTALLGWMALGIDAILPDSGFYVGGTIVARRPVRHGAT